MKQHKLSHIIVVLFLLIFISGCQNKDIDIETFSIATEQVLAGADTVSITGTYDFFKEAESMKINIGRDSTLADAQSHAVTLVGKDYVVTVRNLQTNTKYFYNYSVNVGVHNDFITPTKSFRTLQAQDFTIIVSAIPNEGGTVSGGGTYTQGQQCTVTASAYEGYTFMHWTENDSVVSTDSIYRFVVTGNRVLAAQFALLITEPTVTTGEVTDITQTTAKGSGEVNNDGGAAVTERGLCWSTSHNPTVLGNHATSGTGIGTFSVDMSGLTANTKYYVRAYATNSEGTAYGDEVEFTTSQLNNYTISISANPTNGGTATGGGSFQQGQSCTVRATANTGYTFVNWTESGNQVSANANYTFTVNDNRTLVANFTAGSYIISATVDPENSGTITGAGGYEYGQSCTLKATANIGYTFEKWTENGTQVSTNATYTFSVSGSRSLVAHFKVNSYTITVSANPAAGGVATGGGTFEYGQSCTLSATANSGYNFSNWTEGSNVVSSNSSYTFTVTGNRTLKANFTQQAPQNYTISVSANPTNGGSVTGGGTYQQGQSCTVRATANSGYTFSKWTENGNQVSISANYTFTVNSNRTLVAHFTANPQNYTITVSADPTNGGSVSGGGSYQQGQNCTVTAAANSGYTFSNWTENGNVVSSNTSYSFIVTGNRTLVAHFIANPQNYTITVTANPANGGTVNGGGTYQQGQSCTVTAEANRASSFNVGFEGGIPSDWTVIDANNDGYTWETISTIGNWTNYYNGMTLDWSHSGNNAAISASYINANPMYQGFALNPDEFLVSPQVTLSNCSQLSFWVAAADPSCSADHFGVFVSNTGINPDDFVSVQEWTLSGKKSREISGLRSSRDGRSLRIGTWYNYTVDLSAYAGLAYIAFRHFNCYDQYIMCLDDIELTSNAFTFLNWTENGNVVSTNASYTFTVNSNRNLVANFTQQAPQSYHINVSANPTNGGSVSGGGTYQQGQSCTVHAAANNGYTFVNWTENGTQVSTNANYTFTVNSNRNLVANFQQQAPQTYTISVSADPSSGGSVSGGGTYQQGQNCTVIASANNGYSFTNWTENGNVVSTNASYSFTVTSNRTLVAHFTANPQSFTITVSANPTNGGTVSGGGTYQQGQSCTVSALANSGFSFTNWTENGNVVSSNANYTFTVTGNRTLVAHFTANPQNYTITLSANPNNGGTLAGGGTYQEGQQCTVSASANNGFEFSNWTENGNVVSWSTSYTFTVTSNRTLVANFTAHPTNYTITVSANPNNGGTVTGGGIYQQGQSCTVSATANNGYTFTNWTENGNVVSTNASYSFTVNGNRSLVANFSASAPPQAPTGAIDGLFSVSATQQVWFSRGNLQYNPSLNTWRFASNQYDLIHDESDMTFFLIDTYYCDVTNEYTSSYNGWIDLFGWGTSGYNHGAVCYQPWSTNIHDQYYYSHGDPNSGLYGQSDWGYNAISNGGNTTNLWHTLAVSEWDYIINSRNTSSGIRFAKASINGVNGIILLPDDWNSTVYYLNNTNQTDADWNTNVMSSTQWQTLENNGAVFLPCAGHRSLGGSLGARFIGGINTLGEYWTRTNSYNGFLGSFHCSGTLSYSVIRHYGRSVRLVQNYNP